jgi:general stress protein 26
MKTLPSLEEQQEHFRRLLSRFSTAMLVTHGQADSFHARPMALAQIEPDCGVWFLTHRESAKAHEIQTDTRVLVICQREHDAYLTLSGRATLVENRAKTEAIWKEPFRVWFPDGVEDPDLVLISVIPEDGEFWDNSGFRKIKSFMESAAAYVAGRQPRIEEGEEHGVVHL